MKQFRKAFSTLLIMSMLFTSSAMTVLAEEKEEAPVPVTVNDISVEYADGRSVEDGHLFEVYDSKGDTPAIYAVNGGKLSGIKIMPNEQHKILISFEDADFSFDYEIVMGDDVSFKVGVSENSTQLMRWFNDENGNKVSEEPVNKIVVKKVEDSEIITPVDPEEKPDRKPVEKGEPVTVADIPVVYEDGTPVEDGMKFDVFDMSTFRYDPKHYTVKDGKLSGITMSALAQHKIGFDTKNEYWKGYEVVGAPDSYKLLRIYAKYQNELPLYYDYDAGINAPEVTVEKIVVKKLAEGEISPQTRPTSCVMNLQISDGGYQAEAGLPFRLIRVDNGKYKTVYSKAGELTLIADGNVEYRLELEENPTYKLETPIEFSCLLDKEGKYQAVRKGGDPNNIADYITCKYVELTRIDGQKPQGGDIEVQPEQDGFAPIYVKDMVTLKNMKIMELGKDGSEKVLNKKVKFTFYNATTQTVENEVYSKDGVLPDVKMVKGQNYIVFANDTEYTMPNSYILLNKTGELPQSYKTGQFEDGFYLIKRSHAVDEKELNRVNVDIPVLLEDNTPVTRPVSIKFVSPLETVVAQSTKDGKVNVSLLEDNNYMVLVDDQEYSIESFPLAIKDKSEYGAGKYPFNHFTCGKMSGIILVKKGTEHAHDTVLTSADQKTTLTGLNFRGGDYHLNVTKSNTEIPKLVGQDYEVLNIDTINMYRTEISKLAAGDFTITRVIPDGKMVKAVYYIDHNSELQPVDFSQKDGKVSFHMDSASLYDNVLVYGKNEDTAKPTPKPEVKPSKPATTPQTGDSANIGMWSVIMLSGLACVVVMLTKKNKYR